MSVSLSQQIACVQREIALRKRVYPKWVASGRMEQVQADREIDAMTAALQTLLRFQSVRYDDAPIPSSLNRLV